MLCAREVRRPDVDAPVATPVRNHLLVGRPARALVASGVGCEARAEIPCDIEDPDVAVSARTIGHRHRGACAIRRQIQITVDSPLPEGAGPVSRPVEPFQIASGGSCSNLVDEHAAERGGEVPVRDAYGLRLDLLGDRPRFAACGEGFEIERLGHQCRANEKQKIPAGVDGVRGIGAGQRETRFGGIERADIKTLFPSKEEIPPVREEAGTSGCDRATPSAPPT